MEPDIGRMKPVDYWKHRAGHCAEYSSVVMPSNIIIIILQSISYGLHISNLIQHVNDGSTASKERITAIVITG